MPVSLENGAGARKVQDANILVVDDSVTARVQYSRQLIAAGLKVTQVSNGNDALAKAVANKFDLIVTDVHMPNMSGLELIKELRKLPHYLKVPILVLTSDYSRERLKEGRAVGASGWLIKPPQPNALLKTVKKALQSRR